MPFTFDLYGCACLSLPVMRTILEVADQRAKGESWYLVPTTGHPLTKEQNDSEKIRHAYWYIGPRSDTPYSRKLSPPRSCEDKSILRWSRTYKKEEKRSPPHLTLFWSTFLLDDFQIVAVHLCFRSSMYFSCLSEQAPCSSSCVNVPRPPTERADKHTRKQESYIPCRRLGRYHSINNDGIAKKKVIKM